MTAVFRLLGPPDAQVDGRAVDLGHIRQRSVLAVLLVDANRPVSPDTIVDRVWGDRPSRGAAATVYSYISRLRRALATLDGVELERGVGGYQLAIDPMAVDLHRFRRLCAAGRAKTGAAARALFDEALSLWRGEPLAGIDTPWATREREAALREKFAIEVERVELGLVYGHAAELLAAAQALNAEHPFDERVAAAFMVALYRCGRQAEALDQYEQVRRRLAENLGMDPGPLLRSTHRRILAGDPALAGADDQAAQTGPAAQIGPATQVGPAAQIGSDRSAATPSWLTVPRQLPVPPGVFVGRDAALAELDRAFAAQPDHSDATGIVVIGGSGGVGKTWLALRWAHANLPRFPDGQLYVNLRGFEPASAPLPPEVALRSFLEALGVPVAAIPAQLDAQGGLFRSLTAGRRMLVVLDNARDRTQVIPLLPGATTCTVLVTSRRSLAGLVATHGARPVALDVLDDTEARSLLAGTLGARRVAAEPDAVDVLIRRCAGLPLALGIVAARAAIHPELPVAVLARELDGASTPLDALDSGDLAVSVRAALSCSRAALSDAAAEAFTMLGSAPGADISLPAAASLVGEPVTKTRSLLNELIDFHIIQEPVPGRFRMHDLVRVYAAEHARRAGERQHAAAQRLLDHYLHTAYHANEVLSPGWGLLQLRPPATGVAPEHMSDHLCALAWFHQEQQVLASAVEYAAATGFDQHAWQIAWTLPNFLARRGLWHDQLVLGRLALKAGQRLNDALAQTHAHRDLGMAHIGARNFDEAQWHLCRALDLATTVDDTFCRAQAHRALARLHAHQLRWSEALSHDEQALALYRHTGSVAGEARALNSIGWHLAHLGEDRRAEANCRRAIALYQRLDDAFGQALALDSLAYALRNLSQHREAVDCYRRAIDLFNALDHALLAGGAWAQLGETYSAVGDLPAAHAAWREAMRIYEDLGHPATEKIRDRLRHVEAPQPGGVAAALAP